MVVDLPCGCRVDDAVYDTHHTTEGHYPIGTGPSTFCKHCDQYAPCSCGATERAKGRREGDDPFDAG